MNVPAVAGQTQPTVAIPGVPMPAVSVQTINHQAAGIDLGCSNCSAAQVTLKDASTTLASIPTWAKVIGGLSLAAILIAIFAAFKKPRRT